MALANRREFTRRDAVSRTKHLSSLCAGVGKQMRFGPILVGLLVLLPGCGKPAVPVAEVETAPDQIVDAKPITVAPGDWPWWRGPSHNNVASCDSAPTTWSESDNVTWSAPIPGRGHGSPTILGDRIFMCTADDQSEKQFVVCLNRNNGDQIWSTEVHSGKFPGRGEMHQKSTHANCTVATDGHALFVGFLNAEHITATSLTLDGDIRWQRDLGYFGSKFGYAASPCLHGSLAIYSADSRGGGFLAAVHRDSGEIVWRKARSNVSTYSSAIVTDIAGQPQLLISGDNRVVSYQPETGGEIWSCPGTAEATCGTVVWLDNLVFASGGYPERNTVCIDAKDGSKVWEDGAKCYEQSMLVANDHLFAVTDDGIAICRDARTGEMKWRERLSGPISASPLLIGDLIYATNESGTTWVFRADPDRYSEVAKNQLGTSAFASMIACDGQIFTRVATGDGRNRTETLFCLGEPR